ncbi:MAG: lysophospholipid acyltransferase family protein [Bacteroidales bacterium]
MIKARHHWFYERFFDATISYLMRSDFRDWVVVGDFNDTGGPVLMIGNHFSWWDGFFGRRLNQVVFRRRFHIMMLEKQLEQRMFLSRLGAFSIRKNSRDALESIQYATELLSDPNNLVLLFPQGKFQSQHQFPLTFDDGWFRILKQAPGNTQLIFMACLTDYFAGRKPALSIYLKHADRTRFKSSEQIQQAYNDFLLDAIGQQNESQ